MKRSHSTSVFMGDNSDDGFSCCNCNVNNSDATENFHRHPTGEEPKRSTKRQRTTARVRFASTKAVREFFYTAEERSGMWYTSEERKEFRKELAKALIGCNEKLNRSTEEKPREEAETEERGLEPWKHVTYRQQQREKLLDTVLQEQHQQLLQRQHQSQLLSQLFDFRLKQASQLISYCDQLDAFQRAQADALVARQIFAEDVARASEARS